MRFRAVVDSDNRPLFALHVVLVTIGLFGIAAWLKTMAIAEGPEVWQRDWYCIWETGRALLDGQTEALYTTDYEGALGYFWLYPPYALYPAAMSGALPPAVAYGLLLVGIPLLSVASVWAILRASPATDNPWTIPLLFFGSASFNAVLVTGQNSAFWLVFLSMGLLLMKRGHPLWAAVCLAGWGFKPNWVAWLVLWLVVTRRWRMLGVVALVGLGMVGSSIPLGMDQWVGFFESSKGMAVFSLEAFPVGKLVSVHAGFRSMLPPGWVNPVWWLAEASMLGAGWVIWRRCDDPARQLSAVALLVLAANVYANFYDALLLLFPALVWWTRRDRYSLIHNRLILACLVLSWLMVWIKIYRFVEMDASPVGLFLWAWLMVEAHAVRGAPGEQAPP